MCSPLRSTTRALCMCNRNRFMCNPHRFTTVAPVGVGVVMATYKGLVMAPGTTVVMVVAGVTGQRITSVEMMATGVITGGTGTATTINSKARAYNANSLLRAARSESKACLVQAFSWA